MIIMILLKVNTNRNTNSNSSCKFKWVTGIVSTMIINLPMEFE